MIFAVVFFGLPPALAGLIKPEPDWWVGFVMVLFVGAFGVPYFLLQGVIGVASQRKRLPRRICFSESGIDFETPGKTSRVLLTDCKWAARGYKLDDESVWFMRRRPGVVLLMPEKQVACGFTPETVEQFRAFLELEAVGEIRKEAFPLVILRAVLTALVGGSIGYSIGMILFDATGNDLWPTMLVMLGVIDGLFATLLYVRCRHYFNFAPLKRLNAWHFAPFLLATGFLLVILIGLPSAIASALCNALIGVILSWLCKRWIRQAEEKASHRRVRQEL